MQHIGRFVREIDLAALVQVLLKRVWILIICAAIAFVGAYKYVDKTAAVTYTATASLYVSNNNPNSANYQYASTNDLDSATRLMETYMVVIRSKKVLDVVAERLGGKYDTDYIAKSISLGSVSNTEIMSIDVTTEIPSLSMDICNAVVEVAPAEIIRVVNAGSAEVIDYAALPVVANDRKMIKYGMIAAFLAVAVAGILILLRYLINPHVFNTEDLAIQCNLPILGNIPEEEQGLPRIPLLCKRGIWNRAKERPNSSHVINSKSNPIVAEAYRALRGNLHFTSTSDQKNVILITSATPGEGKSTVCCNLALLSAGAANRVLLIDADIRRPRLAQYLGVDRNVPGLVEILDKKRSFRDAVVRNVHAGLDFLSAGGNEPSPAELLASPGTRALLKELSGQYDLIIIDTPPVNVVNDSLVLVNEKTSLLMVARVGYSRYDEIRTALASIKLTKLEILGFVVTRDRSKTKKQKSHYAAYYRSYYESQADVAEEQASV